MLITYTFNHEYLLTLINLPKVEGYSYNGSKLNSSRKYGAIGEVESDQIRSDQFLSRVRLFVTP